MAQRMIERACDRFRREISSDDVRLIEQTASLDDVKLAIRQIEQQLAARQGLRYIGQIIPFIDAIESYSRALEVAANGTPCLPWIWAPIKFILQAVQDYTHALDKILSAYGSIGLQMPRFSRFAEAFPESRAFQHLVAFLFEDILEFHRLAYAMIRKPGWKIFFKSAWGGFEHRFGDLLNSISKISDQIDREAMSIDIIQAVQQRQKESEDSAQRETQWRTQQLNTVLHWLEATDTDQETKLELLKSRWHEGSLQWATKSPKIRGWLQRGRGKQVLWLYGKPGSGKSVLGAQLISFLRADPSRRVCFFFCDFHTPTLAPSVQIFRAITAQILRMSPEVAPYLYECIGKGQRPTADTLKKLLPHLLVCIDDVRLVVDGIDEISASEHRKLISDLLRFTNSVSSCKLLLISQDIPSISIPLSKQVRLSMAEEEANVQKDLAAIVESSLKDIDTQHDGALGDNVIQSLQLDILEKAKGMFLWVHLVLELLTNVLSLEDLRLQISSLPTTLAEAYNKILNNICSRCSAHDVARIRRVFSWLLYHKGQVPLRKHQIRIGLSLFPGRDSLNDQTKPLPNATDICKPLIEDGPGGSLVFVHSTVPQFLEEYGDIPFINRLESQASIAYVCICQLYQGLDMLESLDTSACTIGIASGQLGLFPYANEHWIDHLLDCFEDERKTTPESIRAVVNRAKLLCQRIMELDTHGSHEGGHCLDEASRDMRLSNLKAVMDPSFVRLMIWLKIVSREPDVDEDRLARAMRVHQEIVESLIQETTTAEVSQEIFLAFKEVYGPIAFVCNVRGCERAVLGFPSKDQLRDHQALHTEAFRCYEKNCVYNDVGFSTARSLQEHKRKRHGTVGLKPVPKRIRRVAKLSGEVEDDYLSDENKDDWECIFNPQTRRKLQVDSCRIIQMTDGLRCIRFSPDGRRIAVGGIKLAAVFETHTGMQVCSLEHESDDEMCVWDVCFSPDDKILVTTALDNLIRVWDIESGTIRRILSGHNAHVYSVDFAPDGSTIASGGKDGVRLWDAQTGSSIASLDVPNGVDGVSSIAISPNSKYVAVGCFSRFCYIFDIEGATLVATLDGPDAHIRSVLGVAFSPDSKNLVTSSADKTIKIWELGESPQCIKTLEGHEAYVNSVAFTCDGRWIVSGSDDWKVRLWDSQTGESQLSLTGDKDYIISVSSSPSGNYLATSTHGNTFRIWSYRELQQSSKPPLEI